MCLHSTGFCKHSGGEALIDFVLSLYIFFLFFPANVCVNVC